MILFRIRIPPCPNTHVISFDGKKLFPFRKTLKKMKKILGNVLKISNRRKSYFNQEKFFFFILK